MWRSMSCAFWRPDPRHGAEPREPSYPTGDRPQRRATAPLPLLDASRLRCGSGLPSNRYPQRGLHGLGRTPRTCARGCRRGCRNYPQFRCTNLTPSCTQTLAVNNMYELPIPDEYVDNVPDDDDLPALSYGVHRLRRIQIPGDIPGLPPARSSDRGERARSGGHRTRVDPYGPQRL